MTTFKGLFIAIVVTGTSLLATDSFAATYNTTPAGGNWSSNGTWTGPSAPPNWGNHTANIYGDVTAPAAIQGFTLITLNNGKTFTASSVTLQNIANFNVISGDIVVNGDLTLNNSTLTITSGNLTVTGTLTLSNGSTINFNSPGSATVGAFTSNGSGGTLNMNNGTFTVNNTLTINSSTTVKIAAGVSASAANLSVGNSGSAILNNFGTLNIAGNITQAGVINNSGTMNVGGNLTSTGSGNSVYTNSGILEVSGNITLPISGKLYVNPGGQTTVDGNVTVGSNENLIIGTNVAPPAYADMVIRQNLISTGSGDVTINRNGRLAVFGDVTDSGGGGTLFTVNNGGQVYVDGNITYSGGGSSITNNNTTNPYGLYVNGTMTSSGGGGTATTNVGDQNTMFTTNKPFYDWVNSLTTPLPVTVMYLKATSGSNSVIISWSTASELNFDKFFIERSADGKIFQPIGEVKGAGVASTTRLDYSFEDINPLTGRAYYRLRSVDLDNSFEYSNIVSVSWSNSHSSQGIHLYPNPVVNHNFTVELNDVLSSAATIRVVSLSGYTVYTGSINESSTQVVLSDDIKPGVYMVQLTSSTEQKVIRVVIE